MGAGWAGAVTARALHDDGMAVEVFEERQTVGGHSRSETLAGVVFEPNGPHIFHTSNPEVARYVQRFGMRRTYEHRVLTEIFLDDDDSPRLLSWPPQVEELRALPVWPRVEKELADLPAEPWRDNLEAYCESIMGPTLYQLFIRDYSVKQWGRHPTELSSRFAPGRLDLRTDGNRRLFRDTWEFFPERGSQEMIESILAPIPVLAGQSISVDDLPALERDFAAVVITAPLDVFAKQDGSLEWRGVRTVSRYLPLADPTATVTPAYVVNRPSLRHPFTRTVETKHATGQRVAGTVLSEEYPGSADRHYPVQTPDRSNERRNESLKAMIRERTDLAVFYCGRLANYEYINQDQAIEQGMACARDVASALRRDDA
ncbi:hypothetical protein GCM10027186_18610 [Micromonospora schwarzwaldensis]